VALLATILSIISPYIIGGFLDSLIEDGNARVIIRFCIIFGGLNLVKILKNYITSIMYVKMNTQMSYDLTRETLLHVQGLSLSYTNQSDSAYLIQRVSIDSQEVISYSIKMSHNLIANTLTLVVPFIVLLHINWAMTVMIVGFLFVYIFSYLAFRKPLHNIDIDLKESQNKYFANLFEQLKYIKLIKVNSIQPEINSRMERGFKGMKGSAIRSQKIKHIYSGLDGIVSTVAQIALFVIGGMLFISGSFTIGMFTVFSIYFGMMLSSARYFFSLGASYQNALVACNRLKDIFTLKVEENGTVDIGDIKKIAIKNVSFAYQTPNDAAVLCGAHIDSKSRNKPSEHVLRNFSAEMCQGKVYAIVGANGGGKTTLINLMTGLYMGEANGTILYNGIDIKNIDLVAARKKYIAFAEQEPMLLNGSVLYNVTYCADDSGLVDSYDVNHLNKYIDCLNVNEFVEKNGLKFSVNDKSTNLSGGEKQKIAILKVLYRNSSVLIFDEPTSALDLQATKKFMSYIQQIKKDKIIILVTHDSYIKGLCDEVIDASPS